MSSRTELSGQVREELERVRRKHGGLLRPVDVVKRARNPESPLHGSFTWNDSVAAHQYRLVQARWLIVRVTVEQADVPEVQAYVSLPSDRLQDDGGYRSLADVLGTPEWYEEMMAEALDVLERAKEKYGMLRELKLAFEEVGKVAQRRGRKEKVRA